MNKIIFYTPKASKNDATIYYIELVKKSFNELGFTTEEQQDLNFNFSKTDYFFTIRTRDFFNLFFKTFSFKILHWFQGIGPEEYLLINGNSLKSKSISILFSIIEFLMFRISFLNFYVSEEMKSFLEKKYFYKKDRYCIVPCYNKPLVKEYFTNTIKLKNSFVYAGSLYGWQCFEETVKLYQEIELNIPEATLTILTKETDKAEEIIKSYNIRNYNIYYVKLEDLDQELSKFQYGFLIREDIPINNVATPTKMNSYLGAGIIPIYSDVINDFRKNLPLEPFNYIYNQQNTIALIEKIKNNPINYAQFYEVCLNIFNNYYNDKKNIALIKTQFKITYEN